MRQISFSGGLVERNEGDTISSTFRVSSNFKDGLEYLLSDLKPVVLWLSNALELLHYFEEHLQSDILLDAEISLPPGCRKSLLGAQEEVMAVLEEVVMYTFQQTVYYITKVLIQ